MMQFNPIITHPTCYDIENFAPVVIDKNLLRRVKVDYDILPQIERELVEGSVWYRRLFEARALNPLELYYESETDVEEELLIHNYTGICPTNVMEVSPSSGSCSVGCQYCLVTNGKHVERITVLRNYAERLTNSLLRNREKRIFYYFSPKTEAFSDPLLYSGIAHDILRSFIRHFDKYPDSNIRLFIATKAGSRHFDIKHKGESVIDLISKFAPYVQVNGSIGIMPQYLRNILEPNAAEINERLYLLCNLREKGVWAKSLLCQPLFLPYLTEKSIGEFMKTLYAAGVRNIKPEFFTAEIRNIVLIAQYINHFDRDKLGEFLYPYLSGSNQDHIKQNSRLAPAKEACIDKLSLICAAAEENGITVSICNWVKRELGSIADWVNRIDTESYYNGYRCLGYQTKLFSK